MPAAIFIFCVMRDAPFYVAASLARHLLFADDTFSRCCSFAADYFEVFTPFDAADTPLPISDYAIFIFIDSHFHFQLMPLPPAAEIRHMIRRR